MEYLQLLHAVKSSSNAEIHELSSKYGIHFTDNEINALRPLLDDISFHWLFTGVPESFIMRVQEVIGFTKTDQLLRMYENAMNEKK